MFQFFSSWLLIFCVFIIGLSIYNIVTQPHHKPTDWLVPVGGIAGGLIGAYVSIKLFPKEVLYQSNMLARMANRLNK